MESNQEAPANQEAPVNRGAATNGPPSPIALRAQQFIDALHALEDGSEDDASALAALFDGQAELTNSALELRGTAAKGRDEILRFWIEYKSTLNGARSHFHHITTSDRAAGLFWTTEGQAANGDAVRYHGATLLDFDPNGSITFFRGYYDTRELTLRSEPASV